MTVFNNPSVDLGDCSTQASPTITPVTMSNATGDNRLVVIILRGGMDGLSTVQPVGDPDFDEMRGTVAKHETGQPTDLDGFYALHPSLNPLMDLWTKGELSFIHAVSTPYRDKRSHFDGQDLLEAGTASLSDGRVRDGWLNRMMQGLENLHGETAFAIGRNAMPVLSGTVPISQWAPSAGLVIRPQTLVLARSLMNAHPQFSYAMENAMRLAQEGTVDQELIPSETLETVQAALRVQIKRGGDDIANFAASRLRGDTRIAAFSLSGWDTHAHQKTVLSGMLRQLASAILNLQRNLGSVWEKTTVVAITEFGRTVHYNGTKGTDHGTGGVMVLAGGALRGGRVIADWPGLAEADLYDRRDLNPTRDVRSHLAWIMRGLFGFEKSFLETTVFPGLDIGSDPRLLL